MARAVLSGGGGGRAEAVPGLAGRGQPVRLARAAEHFMKHHRRRVTSSAVYFFGDVGLPELLAEGVVQARIAEQPSLTQRRPNGGQYQSAVQLLTLPAMSWQP